MSRLPDDQQFWDAVVCAAVTGLASRKGYVNDRACFPHDLVSDAVSVADLLLTVRQNSQATLPAPVTRREGDVIVTTYYPPTATPTGEGGA